MKNFIIDLKNKDEKDKYFIENIIKKRITSGELVLKKSSKILTINIKNPNTYGYKEIDFTKDNIIKNSYILHISYKNHILQQSSIELRIHYVIINDNFIFYSDNLIDKENNFFITKELLRSDSKGDHIYKYSLNNAFKLFDLKSNQQNFQLGYPSSIIFTKEISFEQLFNIKDELIIFLLLFKLPLIVELSRTIYYFIDGITPINVGYEGKLKTMEKLFNDNKLQEDFINRNSNNTLRYFYSNYKNFPKICEF